MDPTDIPVLFAATGPVSLKIKIKIKDTAGQTQRGTVTEHRQGGSCDDSQGPRRDAKVLEEPIARTAKSPIAFREQEQEPEPEQITSTTQAQGPQRR